MKKTILFACSITVISVLGTNNSYGQAFTTVGNAAEANVGIDEIRFQTSSNIRSIRGLSDDYLEIYSNDDENDGPGLFMYSNTTTASLGSAGRIALWTTGGISDYNTDIGFEILHYNSDIQNPVHTPLFTLDKDGDIILKNNSTTYNVIKGNSNTFGTALFADNGWDDGSGIALNGGGNTGVNPGAIDFVAAEVMGSQDENAFTFWKADNTGAWTERLMQVNKSGNVGIGTLPDAYDPGQSSSLQNKLKIDGSILFAENAIAHRAVRGNSNTYGIVLWGNTGWENGSGILLNGYDGANAIGDVSFVATQGNATDDAFTYWTADNISGQWTKGLMKIKKDGQVIIGDVNTVPYTNNNPNYKLYVQTGILTEKVKVALSNDPNNWADFVFNDDYELRSISEVESYIKENKHLPEIPSTDEVHANGLDLAQMDAKLLQKIEELTLYIIQQQKEIDKLNAKMD